MSLRNLTAWFLGGALFVAALGSLAAQETGVDLSGPWKVAFRDQSTFATVEYDDAGWASVSLPGNLARRGAQPNRWLWLRKRVSMPTGGATNWALTLGQVYDYDEVYFNGTLIGSNVPDGTRPTQYGRIRFYPIPGELLTSADSVVAIRLRGAFKNEIGIMGAAPRIQPVQEAVSAAMSPDVTNIIYAGMYFVIGCFFFLLYFRIPELREYVWFGIFAVVLGLLQFTRNEYRFALGNWFLFFKLLEQICYTILPTLYLFFFRNLFRLELPRIIYVYPLVNIVTAVSLLILFNPLWWDRIIGIWFFVNVPFFAYYTYITIRRAVAQREAEAIVISTGTTIMITATLHFFAVERGFADGPSYFSPGALLFVLSVALALIYRMIKLQQEVEDRQQRLNQVNELRDRVFSYINNFVRRPADELKRLSEDLFSDEHGELSRMAVAGEAGQQVDTLQSDLDDILELSRLEVIQEPEYVETVNFNDFITAVIPEGDITCYIKVNPDIVLKTSLELVNSIVIRLIDFPGFRQFQHIDLIITSDLRQNIHFRFLLYHRNFRETRKLYELLTSKNPDRGSLWVKWGIIREVTRILDGDLEISIVNRKFLRIDIRLSAELPPELQRTSRRSGELLIRPSDLVDVEQAAAVAALDGEEQTAIAAAAVAGARVAERPAPPFRKDMTVGEFVQAISARLRRR